MTAPLAALIWCPFPDKDSAKTAAKALLSDQLIACANILPEIESVFSWRGEAACENETAALFKTTDQLMEAAIARLGELHPYDTPAIIGWVCDAAHPQTLGWLGETLGANEGPARD